MSDHTRKPSADVDETVRKIVEFRDVSKWYGKTCALREANFTIERGTILGYIGPNGAGKTTTMRILVGLIKDYSGSVLVSGVDVRNSPEVCQRLLGYLPQGVGFQSWRTVRNVLGTYGRLSGVAPDVLGERTDQVAEAIGLTEYIDRKVSHLSGGTLQKLRLAQALIHEPSLLVLDEPMTGLDPASRYQVKQIVRDIVRKGVTVFLSSHVLSDIEDIATHIAVIDRGTLLRVATPDDLRTEYQLGTTLEVESPQAAKLVTGLDGLPDIESLDMADGVRIQLHVPQGTDLDSVILTVMSCAVNLGVPIRSLRTLRPSLEEIYLKLIDRRGDAQ